ncbi:hypothetical protein GQ53DRAFT_851963 [Thozetella sp. PMI_491]|nr:hypothetical protein GQ53DRAFT_851963 [Thozetella sp. PMI_491]
MALTRAWTYFVLSFIHTAIATSVEPRFLGGVCSPYGGYVQSASTGNGMVQQLSLRIVGTGMYLDNLQIKMDTIEVHQRMMNPFSYIVFFNESDRAGYSSWCTDEDAIITRPESTPLRIYTDTNRDAMLVVKKSGGYGHIPEPYAHFVAGVRQDGVYLGLANRTTWAFSAEKTDSGIDVWKPRLLLGRESTLDGDELRKGEIQGFLRADGH